MYLLQIHRLKRLLPLQCPTGDFIKELGKLHAPCAECAGSTRPLRCRNKLDAGQTVVAHIAVAFQIDWGASKGSQRVGWCRRAGEADDAVAKVGQMETCLVKGADDGCGPCSDYRAPPSTP
jgi:hypothetical protein